jgi:hypothetical protein
MFAVYSQNLATANFTVNAQLDVNEYTGLEAALDMATIEPRLSPAADASF